MEIAIFFFIAGTIILIGFFGGIFFEKTKLPDILVLLLVGILLGPVLKLIDPRELANFTEYFGAFALMVILFDGGMDMDLDRLVKEFGYAFLLVTLSFCLTVACIAIFLYYYSGWNLINSLLLATIVGCTSAAIIIPVVGVMSLKEDVKIILSIESALSDVFAVVCVVSLLQFATLENIGIEKPFRQIASSFSVAILLGLAAGFIWLKVLDLFKGRRYSYMITLAAILILYAIVEMLGGSGPIAVLLFGIVLGNGHDFTLFFRLKHQDAMDETIKFMHGEVTFFVRTFFFVYMGIIISPDFIKPQILYLSLLIVLIIFVARYISVDTMRRITGKDVKDRLVLISMMPRGLATAVLATLPAALNIKGSEKFMEVAFGVIVITNVIMTIGVYFVGKNNADDKKLGLIPN
ncbi:MAG: hypothetical protein CVU52_06155 [Deltaproteobacteria bacterium HGW-Deltaproteobacteria-10]|nr:MAG: hypothetical protein CVU52_06155 [Deltaproteobacteria bacterium HGW-Deltaproteobacteria-10]